MKITAPLLAAFLLLPLHAADEPREILHPSPDASPASIGGQKSLSCTLQLQPDTDATVKLLHWHLSEK